MYCPSLLDINSLCTYFFFKGSQAGGRTWDLLVFAYFLSPKHRLRTLSYCAPQSFPQSLVRDGTLKNLHLVTMKLGIHKFNTCM